MVTQKIKLTLKRYFTPVHRSQPESGFTLLELLMAILVGGMITYGMLALVVNLLGTERQETAKSQVQQEMNQALDYISAEIKQAVFIYTHDKFPTTGLNLGANVQPVIAFWKATPIEGKDLEKLGNPPCASPNSPANCRLVLTNLQTYNLVIYGVQQNQPSDPTRWQEGAARIIRYELPQYSDFEKLTQTDAYGTPPPSSPATFESWQPATPINWNSPGISPPSVLVDGVDYEAVNVNQLQCPNPNPNSEVYTLATPQPNNSFYACVRPFNKDVSQDAILFLRGNAATRAGQAGSKNTAYLPSFERRVQARTVLNRRSNR